MPVTILLIEDSPYDRTLCTRALARLDPPFGPAEVHYAYDASSARAALRARPTHLVLLDYYLPGPDGMDVLEALSAEWPHVPVVMLSGQEDLARAVTMLRAGARDYVPKSPGWDDAVRLVVTRVLEHVRAEAQVASFRRQLSEYVVELEQEVARRTALVEEQARQLGVLQARSEAAQRVKEGILANVSHEFRTPLNGVLGYTAMLADQMGDTTAPEAAEYLRLVRTQGLHLLRLVDSLLALASVIDGRDEPRAAAFSPRALIEDLHAEVLAEVSEKRLAFDCVKPSAGVLRHDSAKIRSIAHELLRNAVKFTDRGTVRIAIDAERDGGVVIEVTDTGIGFAPEHRHAVFDDFH